MSNSETSARGAQIKKKQMILLGAGAAIFGVLALGATYIMTSNAPPPKVAEKPPENVPLVVAGNSYSEREAWRTQTQAQQADLQKKFEELQKQLAERDSKRDEEALKAARASLAPPAPPTPRGGVGGSEQQLNASPQGQVVPPPPPLNLPPPPQRRAANSTPVFSGGPFDPPGAQGTGGAPKETIATITFDEPAKQGSGQQLVEGESGGAGPKQNAGNYIPAGTFARIVVLNGLDAPTGGQSQGNPTPVLLRVIDHATLPNGYRMDLKDCILTANGIGEVSSERALIRLDRLSCVDPKGGAIDIQVRGYVAGEDGKSGMRGKLVTKTGQMLANALLASIGSGIGEAFKNASETTSTTPLGGTVTTPNAGEGFQRGFGAGTQRAFDMLARYYIQLAEKTFPIIEVDGGRVADVVFSRGFVLEGR